MSTVAKKQGVIWVAFSKCFLYKLFDLLCVLLFSVLLVSHNFVAQYLTQKYHWEAMNKRVSQYACDAGRWAGEMDQISATFGSAGITPNLHKGAADIFRMLDTSPLNVETRETYDKSRTLQQTVEIYAAAAKKLRNGKKAAE